jgi:hypothetical protein
MLENLNFSTPERRYSCIIKTFHDSLEKSDQKLLLQYMSDPDISNLGLARALNQKTGRKFSDTSIRKHRLGLCSCSKI